MQQRVAAEHADFLPAPSCACAGSDACQGMVCPTRRTAARDDQTGDERMAEVVDAARTVRPGEEVSPQALEQFFSKHVPELAGKPVEVLQFPGGHSNLTYLLRVGDREVVMRRPPFGTKVKSAHDMGRENR